MRAARARAQRAGRIPIFSIDDDTEPGVPVHDKTQIERRLVLAVRERIYRDGLSAALAAQPGWCVAAATADAMSARDALAQRRADVVLVDVALPGALDLLAFARTLAAPPKVFALALREDDDAGMLAWAEAGAAGFATCENSLDELLACIDASARGELACSPRVSASLLRRVAELAARPSPPPEPPATAPRLAPETAGLTPRQMLILQLLHAGQSNKQIARELRIELATVKNHVHQVLQRLQVRHRHEAAALLAEPASRTPANPA